MPTREVDPRSVGFGEDSTSPHLVELELIVREMGNSSLMRGVLQLERVDANEWQGKVLIDGEEYAAKIRRTVPIPILEDVDALPMCGRVGRLMDRVPIVREVRDRLPDVVALFDEWRLDLARNALFVRLIYKQDASPTSVNGWRWENASEVVSRLRSNSSKS